MIPLSESQLRDIGEWMLHGDTGQSSEALCAAALGTPPDAEMGRRIPYDPSDFQRCISFLTIFPPLVRKQILNAIANASERWSVLVAHWDELVGLWEQERENKTAPALYRRMRALRGES